MNLGSRAVWCPTKQKQAKYMAHCHFSRSMRVIRRPISNGLQHPKLGISTALTFGQPVMQVYQGANRPTISAPPWLTFT